MSAQANYFKLGLFVIVAVFLLCAGVIVLGGGKLFERTFIVETYMTESVEGISKGSAVKYRGIELGQVSNVMIASRKYSSDAFKDGRIGTAVLLELAIRTEALNNPSLETVTSWLQQKAVPAGLRARTAASGLTGPAFIELVYLDPDEFPPPKLSWTPPDLYIPSVPSTTQVLVSAVQSILKKLEKLDVDAIASDADTLLKNVNAKFSDLDTKKITDEAVAFIAEVRKSNDRLQQILNNPSIDPAIADLRETLETAKESTARIDELLHDPRVEKLLANLDRAGDQLPPALQDIRRAVRRIDRLVETQQATIESALTELNEALRNVKNITDDAQQNPARILFGEPPPAAKPGATK